MGTRNRHGWSTGETEFTAQVSGLVGISVLCLLRGSTEDSPFFLQSTASDIPVGILGLRKEPWQRLQPPDTTFP